MKKVLFFIESLAGGGAEKVLTDLVCNMNSAKYEVTVCTVSDNGIYQKTVAQHCKYQSFLSRKDYEAGGLKKVLYWVKTKLIYSINPRIIYKEFIKTDYDIEIAFVEGFATKLIASSPNKKSKKIAWIHTDMNSNPYADRYYSGLNEHIAAYQKMDEVICVSQTVQDSYKEKFCLSNSKVIYNPIDENTIKEKSCELAEMDPNSSLQMVAIGRLVEQKGYDRLLSCLNEIKHYGDFSLWIIGDGPQREMLEKYIQDNHLEKNIFILGFKKNPYKYLAAADIFICSSYAEGFSTAATEALIIGKPVFTVECSGMKELFAGYNCGELVPNTDYDLTKMLKELIQHKFSFENYKTDIKERASQFKLKRQIEIVERILDE